MSPAAATCTASASAGVENTTSGLAARPTADTTTTRACSCTEAERADTTIATARAGLPAPRLVEGVFCPYAMVRPNSTHTVAAAVPAETWLVTVAWWGMRPETTGVSTVGGAGGAGGGATGGPE